MNKTTLIKSTYILTIATLISKVLGSVFRIPLQNIAGDEVLGIYTLVYPVYMVVLILSVAGIPLAIAQLIASARARGAQESISDIFITASIVALSFGVLSSLLIYSFSTPISAALGGSNTRFALVIVSLTLLVAPYMAVYRGFFQGFTDMRPTAVSQVIEQFVRVGIILFVAYYFVSHQYTDQVIAGGVMIGSVFGALASLIYLRITYVRSHISVHRTSNYSISLFLKWGKRILSISIPIAIGTLTMALLNAIDSFTIPSALRSTGITGNDISYLYGIYGRGLALVQIATVFASSIILPLIPMITKYLTEKKYVETKKTIEKSFMMTHLIAWPAAFGLLALTLPLNLALFTDLEGSLLVGLIGLSSVFTSLTVLSTGILQGMNLAKRAAIIIVFGMALKALANIFFIDLFGLNGAGLSTIIVYLLLYLTNSYFIYRQLPFSLFTRNTIKVICSSILIGFLIGVPTLFLTLENWTRPGLFMYIFISITVSVFIYVVLLNVLKAIEKDLINEIPLLNKRLK